MKPLHTEAIELLRQLISIPSFSKEENGTASAIEDFFHKKGIPFERKGNNIWAKNKHFKNENPNILLNSHHDTVKPNEQYSRDPFDGAIEKDKIFGLGSNDAGGSLVALIAIFVHYYDQADLKFNLVIAATAEEENSGDNGLASIFSLIPKISFAIVGEPTLMRMAICERGLLVLDCVAYGKAGHAARKEGINSIYKAIEDINWLHNYKFEKISDLLGSVEMNVTVIETENKLHNMVPSKCNYIADIRVNELYTFEEILKTIRSNIKSVVTERSMKMRSTLIPPEHDLVKAGIASGLSYYGSPTTSDKAIMPFPALKLGPGDSARSHIADEFIFCSEIEDGIDKYIQILNKLLLKISI